MPGPTSLTAQVCAHGVGACVGACGHVEDWRHAELAVGSSRSGEEPLRTAASLKASRRAAARAPVAPMLAGPGFAPDGKQHSVTHFAASSAVVRWLALVGGVREQTFRWLTKKIGRPRDKYRAAETWVLLSPGCGHSQLCVRCDAAGTARAVPAPRYYSPPLISGGG